MNLPNVLTGARIVVAPLIAWLVLAGGWQLRLAAFWLFIAAAITDYFDGRVARSRNLVTDLGRLLDPLADKLLLLGTLIPMYVLMTPPGDSLLRALPAGANRWDEASAYPFITPFGDVGLPWYLLLIVLGRELFMTLFRQAAAHRGVVIAAIGPAKVKTAFQSVWVGSALFWLFAAALARTRGWVRGEWEAFALFNGTVGLVTMVIAIALTVYSLGLYVGRYGYLLAGRAGRA
ncbi:MAG: CDP-alcohol phosphatidyltransferase family protein [Gemmatimonadaceae bacterium]